MVGPESPERKSFCWLPNLDGAILFIYCYILFFLLFVAVTTLH